MASGEKVSGDEVDNTQSCTAMEDTRLWERLLQKSQDWPRLLPQLEQLADLPMAVRWPFLGSVSYLFRSDDHRVRCAALKTLRGVTGYDGLQQIVRMLDDNCEHVRQVAVETLAESAKKFDPPRMAHAVFHPREDVRRAALERIGGTAIGWYALYLISEDADRQLALAALEHSQLSPYAIPVLLDLYDQTQLSREQALDLLTQLDPHELGSEVLQPQRDYQIVAELLDHLKAESTFRSMAALEIRGHDLIDRLVHLFLDDASERGDGRLREWLSRCQQRCLMNRETPSSLLWFRRLTVSLWRSIRDTGAWNVPVLECFAFQGITRPLTAQEIPRAIRRDALGIFYHATEKSSMFDDRASHESLAAELLQSDLTVRDNGDLDLWALGAILHLVDWDAYEWILAKYSLKKIAKAFVAEPLESATFFRLPAHSPVYRERLVASLCRRAEFAPGFLSAVLMCSVNADGYSFLEEIDTPEALGLIQHYPAVAKQMRWSATISKVTAAGQRLAARLADHLSEFLDTWLLLPDPHKHPIATEVFVTLARRLSAKSFAERVEQLEDAQIERLLNVIPLCGAIPYGHELQLAKQLAKKTSPVIASWCEARQTLTMAAPVAFGSTSGAEEVPLRPFEASEILAATDATLSAAMAPALTHPRSGLCAALERRLPPYAPLLDVCSALLACLDPIAQVDREFARFATPHPPTTFLSKLDATVVAHWGRCSELSLLGHAWLWRWEKHAFAFGDRAAQDEESLCQVLLDSFQLRTPLLRTQFWEVAHRLCAVWRSRNRARFRQVAGEELLKLAVESLTTDVDEQAAAIVMIYHRDHERRSLLTRHRQQVTERLPEIAVEVREKLEPWISSRGLVGVTVARQQVTALKEEDKRAIQQSVNLDKLAELCCSDDLAAVSEAVLRILDFGEPGLNRLASILAGPNTVAGFARLAETLPMWADGASLDAMRTLAVNETTAPFRRFHLGLGFLERGELALAAATLDATLDTELWFVATDWIRLTRTSLTMDEIASVLVRSPQPVACRAAVEHFLKSPPDDAEAQTGLRDFLLQGMDRFEELRCDAAAWLLRAGDDLGAPILVRQPRDKVSTQSLDAMSVEAGKAIVDAVFWAGSHHSPESKLMWILLLDQTDERLREYGFRRLAFDGSDEGLAQSAAARLPWDDERHESLRSVARVFHEGMQTARELTGKSFAIEMIGGTDFGYTRLHEPKIFINPRALLERDRQGEAIVHGLIVHEIGHHLYHVEDPKDLDDWDTSDEVPLSMWERAVRQGLGPLMNLVADEHLERNLRVVDKRFGNQLQRLASYAFQHCQKDIAVDRLLALLSTRALQVLGQCKLRVGRQPGSICLDTGKVLAQAERQGMSFPRFMRALRMGLGNRHDDPLVEQALGLFDKQFRKATMAQLYEIAVKLREIFQAEAALVDMMGQDRLVASSEADLRRAGRGITNEQIQREIVRITRREQLATGGTNSAATVGPRCINLLPDLDFPPITKVVPVEYDRASHRHYAGQVAADARRLRQFLANLGVRYLPARHRLRGTKVDQPRLRRVVLQRDPRMMIARERQKNNDLFVGIVIDCSGSMDYSDHLKRAKRFGSLVAEAARNLENIDVRLFGFTESVIYDAGTAHYPAVSRLETGGGNNDAAALWHAAQVAMQSKRKSKLLVMISDGLPTECSAAALTALVRRLTYRSNICCAQVAVQPLEERCFEHYVVLNHADAAQSVREFGLMISKLIQQTMGK